MIDTVEFDTIGRITDEWSKRGITGKVRLTIPTILFHFSILFPFWYSYLYSSSKFIFYIGR